MRTNWFWTGALVAALLVLAAGVTEAVITGSAHDFSAETWNPGGEICEPCHTPHHGNTTVADAPLWNHDVTAVTAYSLYNSSTIDATDIGEPGARSKLCLSCHDGTVAVDSFGGAVGTEFIGTINADAEVGTDLTDDHPISFTYDATLFGNDPELYNPTTQNSGLGGTIQDDLLFNNKMECASCHDPHNTAGQDHLLVKSNAASALCLTCHNK